MVLVLNSQVEFCCKVRKGESKVNMSEKYCVSELRCHEVLDCCVHRECMESLIQSQTI